MIDILRTYHLDNGENQNEPLIGAFLKMEVYLIYNITFISGVQHSNSAFW